MAAVLNEVIAQAAALITWRSGPSKWQPQEAGCLSPPVGAQYPVISASHLEPSGHPCLGMAKGRPWPMCCWGRAVVGGKAAPSPASQVKSSSPVLRRGGGGAGGGGWVFLTSCGICPQASLLFRMLVEPRHCQALHWAWGVRSQNPVAQRPWSGSAQVPCAVSIQLSSVQPWACSLPGPALSPQCP